MTMHTESEYILRVLLWKFHGCNTKHLSGGLTSFKCHKCNLDFATDSVEDIERRLNEIALAKHYIKE